MLPSEQLIANLNRLGVNFVSSQGGWVQREALEPAVLLANLALNPEARVRLAIIPLLLIHPAIHVEILRASVLLAEQHQAQLTLKLFYTAATLLQAKYQEELLALVADHTHLPDIFTDELRLRPNTDTADMLIQLARRHSELMKLSTDWANSYDHAVQRCLSRLRKEKQWLNESGFWVASATNRPSNIIGEF